MTFRYSHIFREGNKVADALANHARPSITHYGARRTLQLTRLSPLLCEADSSARLVVSAFLCEADPFKTPLEYGLGGTGTGSVLGAYNWSMGILYIKSSLKMCLERELGGTCSR
ncbi:hypothetical protein ACLB2K_006846 [Fragaria x ananassa]